jgi:hypothetical protein
MNSTVIPLVDYDEGFQNIRLESVNKDVVNSPSNNPSTANFSLELDKVLNRLKSSVNMSVLDEEGNDSDGLSPSSNTNVTLNLDGFSGVNGISSTNNKSASDGLSGSNGISTINRFSTTSNISGLSGNNGSNGTVNPNFDIQLNGSGGSSSNLTSSNAQNNINMNLDNTFSQLLGSNSELNDTLRKALSSDNSDVEINITAENYKGDKITTPKLQLLGSSNFKNINNIDSGNSSSQGFSNGSSFSSQTTEFSS